MATSPLVPVVLFAAVVGSGVALLAWVGRDTPGAKPLAAFMIGASCWALAEGMTLVSPTLGAKVFWTRLTATVSVLLPVAWLATVVAYTETDWRLTGRRFGALLVEPVAFVALVWTNEGPHAADVGVSHALVWTGFSTEFTGADVVILREYGLAFWAHLGYSYLLLAAGALVLVRLNFRTSRVFRGQATALLAGVSAPLFANALTVFDALPPDADLTSVGFVVTGLVLAVAILRGELLSVSPVTRSLGRETVVAEMDDAVVIVDDEERVVDANAAALELFGVSLAAVVGEDLEAGIPALASAVDRLESRPSGVELDGPEGRRYYDVSVSPLTRDYGGIGGYVVSLRDVTDRRRREQRLDVLNRLVRHNLRNELNVVYGNAELLKPTLTDPAAVDRVDRIEETVETIIARSEKVGRVSRIQVGTSTRPLLLVDWLEEIVADVEADYPALTVRVDVPRTLVISGGESLEHAFVELLSNAAEHADDAVSVELSARRSDAGDVVVRVSDDGPGIEPEERAAIETGRETALEHGSGVGLWLVTWVVEAYGGTVGFEDADAGCTVVVTLPTAESAATIESERPLAEADD